ncbi:MAG TPA: amino acid ABC transporter permease [Candidatus Limnocylindrales bacterium]|jgi:polar amino acid transport system permease protein|nr:amino acid ABC transporter permease [Candidatus Limnocylindrales bacterium]
MTTADNNAMAGSPPGLPAIVVAIEKAKRREAVGFRVRFVLTWLVIVTAVVGLVVIGSHGNPKFHLDEWLPFIVGGVWMTLFLSITSIVFAVMLAIFGALGRLSTNPIANGVASLYVSLVRGTPLIVQIFFIFLGLPAMGIVIPDVPTGILALSFNYGAYLTEVFRAGIQAVPQGQVEAARSLGLPERQVLRRIVLPQAIRIVTPAVANDFIAMTKDSALVSVVGVQELLWRAGAAGRPYNTTFQTIAVAAGIYWLLTIILSFFQARLERRMAAGDRNR